MDISSACGYRQQKQHSRHFSTIPQPGIPESFRVMLKELQSLGLDVVVQDKEGNEIDMRQNFDDEETGFDMRDVAGTETVANENELLNDYTISDHQRIDQ